MARPRSERILEIKAALTNRLRNEQTRPGGRFLSARALAAHFQVSYKSAHRLLVELQEEGLLERRASSGTYHAGRSARLRGVQVVFQARAKERGTLGADLLARIEAPLRARGVRIIRSWGEAGRAPALEPGFFPIIWECPGAVREAVEGHHFCLSLNNSPPPGSAAALVDAISTDDFSGGASAAEILKQCTGRAGAFAVLGGPKGDARSQRRIAGFCAHVDDTWVCSIDSWDLGDARRHAASILARKPSGIFGCSDRLAQAVVEHARTHGLAPPPIVGFDNAPVAAEIGLTTVGIPWNRMVDEATSIAAERLAGSGRAARYITLPHEVVRRITA